jgi:hypothetical protein
MQTGSAGILFGLYKYSLLLKKQTSNLEPNWVEQSLKVGIDMVLSEACDDTEVFQTNSFLSSQIIGTSTLAVL